VVFLSVPHRGTNIADWVRGQRFWREAVVAQLRAAVAGSQWPLLDRIENGGTGALASWSGANLFLAVQDALREADCRYGRRGATRTADAQEADSELALYLRLIATDFSVIDDLTARSPRGPARSPAHFTPAERAREIRRWKKEAGITVLSFVTRGPSPFRFNGKPRVWALSDPRTWPELTKDSSSSAGTDIVYRACYRACAGGPFEAPAGAPPGLAAWENDGIVNTASMYWPYGDHIAVECDHMDIVGHYALEPDTPGEGRRYRAYDLLGSAAAFDSAGFQKVWRRIFAFAAGSRAATAASTG